MPWCGDASFLLGSDQKSLCASYILCDGTRNKNSAFKVPTCTLLEEIYDHSFVEFLHKASFPLV